MGGWEDLEGVGGVGAEDIRGAAVVGFRDV